MNSEVHMIKVGVLVCKGVWIPVYHDPKGF